MKFDRANPLKRSKKAKMKSVPNHPNLEEDLNAEVTMEDYKELKDDEDLGILARL